MVSVNFPPGKKTQALAFETIFSRILPILSEGLGDGWGAVRATDRIITDWKIPGNYKVETTRLRSTNFVIKSPRKVFLCGAKQPEKQIRDASVTTSLLFRAKFIILPAGHLL